MSEPALAEVVAAVQRRYDPAWAEDWDAVGLVCGDPDAPVGRVHFAVDPVTSVVDEALAAGADLLVTHHPLLLRGVHGVAATTAKGRLVHRLIQGGCALLTVHTNADVADPGVSDALAEALGLLDIAALSPSAGNPQDKLVTFVPAADVDRVIDALSAAGAGVIGEYSRCAWTASGIGTFRPEAGANPTIGSVGAIEEVPEARVEMVLPRERRRAALAALTASHPYEEPAYDLYELAPQRVGRGLGRIGRLDSAEPLETFVRRVAAALPRTTWGVRASGAPDRPVRTVAVCGGAGGELAAVARRSGADALVTADLRHHPASELAEEGGLCLVDAAHWATEWPWLPVAAAELANDFAGSVETSVSRLVTDPWTLSERP